MGTIEDFYVRPSPITRSGTIGPEDVASSPVLQAFLDFALKEPGRARDILISMGILDAAGNLKGDA